MAAVPIKDRKLLDPSFIFGGVEPTSDEERTTHDASCHCGEIQYKVTLKWPFPKYTVNTCSCSICTTQGYLLVYPCRRDVNFTEGKLSSLTFVLTGKTNNEKVMKSLGGINSHQKPKTMCSARIVARVLGLTSCELSKGKVIQRKTYLESTYVVDLTSRLVLGHRPPLSTIQGECELILGRYELSRILTWTL